MCGSGMVAGASGGGAATQVAAASSGATIGGGADLGALGEALKGITVALQRLTELIGSLIHSAGASAAGGGAKLVMESNAKQTDPTAVKQTVTAGGASAYDGNFLLGWNSNDLDRMESVTGRKAELVRFFDRMADHKYQLSAKEKAAVASGHTLFTSLKPEGTWQDIASGKQDAQLIQYLKSLRDEGGGKVFFAFNHEADGKQNAQRGSGADFAAAWRHVYQLAEQLGATSKQGGPINFVWTMTGYGFQPNVDRVSAFYPGSQYVDVIGADTYNMGWNGKDSSFAQQMQPVIDWMKREGIDKPVLLPELGTVQHAGDPGAQARWLADAANQLKTNPDFARVIGAMYWNSEGNNPDVATKDFRLDDAGMRAYATLDH